MILQNGREKKTVACGILNFIFYAHTNPTVGPLTPSVFLYPLLCLLHQEALMIICTEQEKKSHKNIKSESVD